MLRLNLTVTSWLKDSSRKQNHQGKLIEVIETDDFVKDLEKINIYDFKDSEINSLLQVLSKPHLDKWIQLSDLREILLNFGVREFEQEQKQNNTNIESQGGGSEQDDPRKRKKKNLNYDSLDKQSLFLLASFTDYLLDTDTSVYEFFDGFIYNQVVRTKNKQSVVEIMQSNEFFNKIQENEGLMQKVGAKEIDEDTKGNSIMLTISRKCLKLFMTRHKL